MKPGLAHDEHRADEGDGGPKHGRPRVVHGVLAAAVAEGLITPFHHFQLNLSHVVTVLNLSCVVFSVASGDQQLSGWCSQGALKLR